MELSGEILEEIKQQCRNISYGSITIHLREEANTIDIELNERKRFAKESAPYPGKVVVVKRVSRNDS